MEKKELMKTISRIQCAFEESNDRDDSPSQALSWTGLFSRLSAGTCIHGLVNGILGQEKVPGLRVMTRCHVEALSAELLQDQTLGADIAMWMYRGRH